MGVTGGCGQCPGTGFQKVGAYGKYCCLVSSFGLLVSFQLVIGILQHFSIVLVSTRAWYFF